MKTREELESELSMYKGVAIGIIVFLVLGGLTAVAILSIIGDLDERRDFCSDKGFAYSYEGENSPVYGAICCGGAYVEDAIVETPIVCFRAEER